MAQTEEMKRLLKDGKIVGYEKHSIWNDRMVTYHSINMDGWATMLPRSPNITDGFTEYIPSDSFDLGIKVNGEWWFEGAKVKYMIGGIYILSYGEYYFGDVKQYGWYTNLEGTKHCEHFDIYENMRHIGNIHEDK